MSQEAAEPPAQGPDPALISLPQPSLATEMESRSTPSLVPVQSKSLDQSLEQLKEEEMFKKSQENQIITCVQIGPSWGR